MIINSFSGQQCFVGAPFLDSVRSKHQYFRSVLNRCQPVCNRKCRSPLCKPLKRCLNDFFAFVIKCRSRFVQNQNRRIFQKYTGNTNPLFLSTRKFHAAFSYISVIALRQFFDKFVCPGADCRVLNFRKRCARFPVSDIFENRSRK